MKLLTPIGSARLSDWTPNFDQRRQIASPPELNCHRTQPKDLSHACCSNDFRRAQSNLNTFNTLSRR